MKKSWMDAVTALNQQGHPFVLITIVGVQGSAPRNCGAKIVVTRDSCYDTIGGGTLEFNAIHKAKLWLQNPRQTRHELQIEHIPLGVKVGQCCGGRVSLLFECFPGRSMNIAIFGAGHIARSLIDILCGLMVQVTWIDERPGIFPVDHQSNISPVCASDPVQQVDKMPPDSVYLILTHDHERDFQLCSRVLKRRDARYIGLIGSQTKWLRFQNRFVQQGMTKAQFEQIHCPVGARDIPGKRPMEIAVSIAAQLIKLQHRDGFESQKHQGVLWSDLKGLVRIEERKKMDLMLSMDSLEDQKE